MTEDWKSTPLQMLVFLNADCTFQFVVFLTAANHNVRNAHAVLMKRSYSVVGFRLTG